MVHKCGFCRFKDVDLVEQVHNFGFSSIHTYGSNIRLIRLFINYAKPRKSRLNEHESVMGGQAIISRLSLYLPLYLACNSLIARLYIKKLHPSAWMCWPLSVKKLNFYANKSWIIGHISTLANQHNPN